MLELDIGLDDTSNYMHRDPGKNMIVSVIINLMFGSYTEANTYC